MEVGNADQNYSPCYSINLRKCGSKLRPLSRGLTDNSSKTNNKVSFKKSNVEIRQTIGVIIAPKRGEKAKKKIGVSLYFSFLYKRFFTKKKVISVA